MSVGRMIDSNGGSGVFSTALLIFGTELSMTISSSSWKLMIFYYLASCVNFDFSYRFPQSTRAVVFGVLAQRAGVGVALAAAGNLAGVRFLQKQYNFILLKI